MRVLKGEGRLGNHTSVTIKLDQDTIASKVVSKFGCILAIGSVEPEHSACRLHISDTLGLGCSINNLVVKCESHRLHSFNKLVSVHLLLDLSKQSHINLRSAKGNPFRSNSTIESGSLCPFTE